MMLEKKIGVSHLSAHLSDKRVARCGQMCCNVIDFYGYGELPIKMMGWASIKASRPLFGFAN